MKVRRLIGIVMAIVSAGACMNACEVQPESAMGERLGTVKQAVGVGESCEGHNDCDGGLVCCDEGKCMVPDEDNCAACETPCPEGSYCVMGSVHSDNHCYGADVGDTCSYGETGPYPDNAYLCGDESDGSLIAGLACCIDNEDDACRQLNTDELNCGECGNECGEFESCCTGSCTETDEDLQNCGGCGNDCGTSADECVSGVCKCDEGAACSSPPDCGSSGCTDFDTDEDNCGGAGIVCSGTTDTCSSGTCTCGGGAACSGGDECVSGECKTPCTTQYPCMGQGSVVCYNGYCTPSSETSCTTHNDCHNQTWCDTGTGQCKPGDNRHCMGESNGGGAATDCGASNFCCVCPSAGASCASLAGTPGSCASSTCATGCTTCADVCNCLYSVGGGYTLSC